MKHSLGPKNSLYPLPTTLVGMHVDGKPNYVAIAHVGVMALHCRPGFPVGVGQYEQAALQQRRDCREQLL